MGKEELLQKIISLMLSRDYFYADDFPGYSVRYNELYVREEEFNYILHSSKVFNFFGIEVSSKMVLKSFDETYFSISYETPATVKEKFITLRSE